jgi:uncharacterized protein
MHLPHKEEAVEFAGQYGPWAVVCGASEGTGQAISRHIAREGVPVLLVARRQAPLADLASRIKAEFGTECDTATVDLASPQAAAQVIAAVGEREVGLYVANAGADPNGSHFLDADLRVWDDLVFRNVVNVTQLSHHFGRAMKARGRGGIVLVNSGSAYGGGDYLAVYSATKAYLLNFGESLWSELLPHGVSVLNMLLSMTDTPAFRELLAEKGLPVPPGIAAPDDVAKAVFASLGQVPVYNWGQADDEQGRLPMSAASRRNRVLAINESTKAVFG